MTQQTTCRLPDFLIIGGSKCGTHWLNECLREHPGVHVTPEVHEIFFFDRYFDRGAEWYARYFKDARDDQRVGDITPTYLANELAPARVHELLPGATLIVSLRNPITRAWSKYLHLWRKGDVPSDFSFEQACAAAPEILADGEYARCLKRWLAVFPAAQIHFLVLEDAKADPFAYVRRMYEIIGVDADFRAKITADKTNEHQTPRSMLLAKAAFRFSRFLHRHRLHWAVDGLKALGLKRAVLKSRKDEKKDPAPLSLEQRARLAEHFRNDVRELAGLLNRDLESLWLTTRGG